MCQLNYSSGSKPETDYEELLEVKLEGGISVGSKEIIYYASLARTTAIFSSSPRT